MEVKELIEQAKQMYTNHNRKIIQYSSIQVGNMVISLKAAKAGLLSQVKAKELRYSEYQQFELNLNFYIHSLSNVQEILTKDEQIWENPHILDLDDKEDNNGNGRLIFNLIMLIGLALLVIVPIIKIIIGSGAGFLALIFAIVFFGGILMAAAKC